jgi:hypothetical protein
MVLSRYEVHPSFHPSKFYTHLTKKHYSRGCMLLYFSRLTYTFQALHSPHNMAGKNDSNEQLEDRKGSDEEKQTGVQPATEFEGNKVGLRTVNEGFSPDQVVAEVDEAEG